MRDLKYTQPFELIHMNEVYMRGGLYILVFFIYITNIIEFPPFMIRCTFKCMEKMGSRLRKDR